MFDLVAENYPVEGINWADKRTPPALDEALNKFDKALIGGLDENKTLLNSRPKDVEEEVFRTIEILKGRHLIIAPGCVIPLNTPEGNLDAAIRAARSWRPQT
jgi:uroporphyrinogen decarboxylase